MCVCPQCRLRFNDEASHCVVDGSPLETLDDPRLGSELGGRYRLEEVLGRGGMATVYRAVQPRLREEFAIKILHGRFADDDLARTRLEREAAAAAQLSHPNIVEMYDVGQTEDLIPYVAMELLAGDPLDEYLTRHGPLDTPTVIQLGLQIARGLSRAHDFDVIHRDIKPSNIFVCQSDDEEPVVKLVDFGLALVAGNARLTAGELIGSPRYMAPERFRNRAQAIPRSDLYSLGVVLFEMATGTLPFESESMAGYVLHHLESKPPRASVRNTDCPEALCTLIDALLAKDPEDRPTDAHVVVGQLSELASERALRIRHVSSFTTRRFSLIPSPVDTWTRRQEMYEEMAGHLADHPVQKDVEAFGECVGRLHTLNDEADAIERAQSTRDEALRIDRERVGHAVETLARDLSRVRTDGSGEGHAARYQHALAGLVNLDMQSPETPTDEGLTLLKEAEKAYRDWLRSRRHSGAQDLEYQLAALRARLDGLEKDAAEARSRTTSRLEAIAGERQLLETELIALSQHLGTVFGGHPATAPLFQRLRASS